MERFACGISTARNRLVSSHRAHGPGFVSSLLRGMVLGGSRLPLFSCALVLATLSASIRGARVGVSVGDDRAMGHQATSNNAANKDFAEESRCY